MSTTTTTVQHEEPHLRELIQAFSFDISPSLTLFRPPSPPDDISYLDEYGSEWGSQWEEDEQKTDDKHDDGYDEEDEGGWGEGVDEEDGDDDDGVLVPSLQPLNAAPQDGRRRGAEKTPTLAERTRLQQHEIRMDELERQQEIIAQRRHEEFQEKLHAQIQAQLSAIQAPLSPEPESESWPSRAIPPVARATGLNSHPINDFDLTAPGKAATQQDVDYAAEAEHQQELAIQRQQQIQAQLASIHEHRMSIIQQQQTASLQSQQVMHIQQDQVFTIEEERLSVIPEEDYYSSSAASQKAKSPEFSPTFYFSSSGAQSSASSSQPSSRKPSQQLADPLCPPTLTTTITGPSTPLPTAAAAAAAAATEKALRSGYAPLGPLHPQSSHDDDTHHAFRWLHELHHKAVDSINSLATKYGGTGFVPDSLQQECDKAAVILRAFCTKGVYYDHHTTTATAVAALAQPKAAHRSFPTIPPRVITRAVGLAIFTTFRAGLQITGACGSGVLIARLPDGRWGPPAAIQLHSLGAGVVSLGVDVYDGVIVINSREALTGFMRSSVRVGGGDLTVVAGPWGVSHQLEWASTPRPKPPPPPSNQHLAPPTPRTGRSASVSSASSSTSAVSAVPSVDSATCNPDLSAISSPAPAPFALSPLSSAGHRTSFFSVSSLSSHPSTESRRSSISSSMSSSQATATPDEAAVPSPTLQSLTTVPPPPGDSVKLQSEHSRHPSNLSSVDQKTKKPPRFAPVFSYVKSRGLYAGLGCDLTNIEERAEANAEFYGDSGVTMAQILQGDVVSPAGNESLQNLYDVIRGAELGTRRRSKISGRRPSVESSVENVIRSTYGEAAGANNLFDAMVISSADSTRRTIW